VKEYALSSSKLESEKRKKKQRETLLSACEKVLKAYERMTTGIDLGTDAALFFLKQPHDRPRYIRPVERIISSI